VVDEKTDNGEIDPDEGFEAEPETNGEASAAPAPLWRQIKEATGASDRRAKYDAAVARAFTERQLMVLHAAEVNDQGMKFLAAIKDDKERDEAVRAVAEDAKRIAVERLRPEPPGDRKLPSEMTNEGRLEAECGEIRERLDDRDGRGGQRESVERRRPDAIGRRLSSIAQTPTPKANLIKSAEIDTSFHG